MFVAGRISKLICRNIYILKQFSTSITYNFRNQKSFIILSINYYLGWNRTFSPIVVRLNRNISLVGQTLLVYKIENRSNFSFHILQQLVGFIKMGLKILLRSRYTFHHCSRCWKCTTLCDGWVYNNILFNVYTIRLN